MSKVYLSDYARKLVEDALRAEMEKKAALCITATKITSNFVRLHISLEGENGMLTELANDMVLYEGDILNLANLKEFVKCKVS